MNEQSERYERLYEAIKEIVELGASDETLEVLCLESGFSSKHLEQTKREVDKETADFMHDLLVGDVDTMFKKLIVENEGRN